MARLPTLAWIAATSALLSATPAFAQSADAEALFGEGDALMKQGKLAEACDAFEASNKVESRAGTLIRLGECREANHQLASAWSAYKDALVRVKDPKKKDIATAKVAELQPRLSYLTVAVAPDARIDGLAVTRNGQPLDPVLWNHGLPVNGGDYAISARAPGKAEWKTTVTVPNEKGKITVDVPKLAEPSATPPKPNVTTTTTTTSGSPPPPDEPDDRAPRPGMWTGKRKVALAAGGVAVAAVVAGAVFGSAATSKKDKAYELCPDPQVACNDAATANDLLDQADARALRANITFGVAGAAAITAGVLWVIGKPAAEHHVAVAPARGGIVVVGRF